MQTEYIDVTPTWNEIDYMEHAKASYVRDVEQQNRKMRITLSRILLWWDTQDKHYANSILADDIREVLK
jgi:hypothetical protein